MGCSPAFLQKYNGIGQTLESPGWRPSSLVCSSFVMCGQFQASRTSRTRCCLSALGCSLAGLLHISHQLDQGSEVTFMLSRESIMHLETRNKLSCIQAPLVLWSSVTYISPIDMRIKVQIKVSLFLLSQLKFFIPLWLSGGISISITVPGSIRGSLSDVCVHSYKTQITFDALDR